MSYSLIVEGSIDTVRYVTLSNWTPVIITMFAGPFNIKLYNTPPAEKIFTNPIYESANIQFIGTGVIRLSGEQVMYFNPITSHKSGTPIFRNQLVLRLNVIKDLVIDLIEFIELPMITYRVYPPTLSLDELPERAIKIC